MGFLARAFPFVENPAPHRTEDDNAGHVQGPRGKAELAHLGLAHGVKEELKIPSRAGQGAEEIVSEHRNFQITLHRRREHGG